MLFYSYPSRALFRDCFFRARTFALSNVRFKEACIRACAIESIIPFDLNAVFSIRPLMYILLPILVLVFCDRDVRARESIFILADMCF